MLFRSDGRRVRWRRLQDLTAERSHRQQRRRIRRWRRVDRLVDAVAVHGIVVGHEREYGSFFLSELEAIRYPDGKKRIERDLHFSPRKVGDCK